jgi:hypothetical protein
MKEADIGGVIYIPFLQKVFNTQAIGVIDWSIILAISTIIFFLSLIINKLFDRKKI